MEEIDLKEILNIFWRKKVHILIITLLFVMIGCVYSLKLTKPIYSSSITILLVSSNENENKNEAITSTDVNLNKKLIATYSELIRSKSVLNQVISNLNLSMNVETLRKNLSVGKVENTDIIKVTVKDENPNTSSKIVNEIAKVFMQRVKELYNINNVQTMDEAGIPTEPEGNNHKKNIAIFFLAGIVVSGIYVIVLNMLDNTIKTADDIENEFALPVLASIPDYEESKGGKTA